MRLPTSKAGRIAALRNRENRRGGRRCDNLHGRSCLAGMAAGVRACTRRRKPFATIGAASISARTSAAACSSRTLATHSGHRSTATPCARPVPSPAGRRATIGSSAGRSWASRPTLAGPTSSAPIRALPIPASTSAPTARRHRCARHAIGGASAGSLAADGGTLLYGKAGGAWMIGDVEIHDQRQKLARPPRPAALPASAGCWVRVPSACCRGSGR